MESVEDILNQLTRKALRPAETVSKERFMAEANRMADRGFVFDEEGLKLLKSYLANQSGLLLLGNVGCGKTFFFKAREIPVLSMQTICEHTLSEISTALKAHEGSEILVDDIGAEGEFNNFGTKQDILQLILETRLATPERTHFTTNLKMPDLYARYGARTFDRLKELAKLYTLEGGSKRCADGVRLCPVDFFTPRLWKDCAERCRYYNEADRSCVKKVRREPKRCEFCPWF